MRMLLIGLLAFSMVTCDVESDKLEWSLVLHGGAGTIKQENMAPGQEARIRSALQQALEAGQQILSEGGSAIDAVETSIRILEDSPEFNAGKGAVFTAAGTNELDASIMDGSSLNAGAVTGVQTIANPISLARRVMSASPHVMLAGRGAEAFAREQGIDSVTTDYFWTQHRWDQLMRKRDDLVEEKDDKHGTVGAVALDHDGDLAAGTSTGGMTNKRYGRIGDSPIIGAGTYANNKTCAISATGHGEYFMRLMIAHDISAGIEYGNKSLKVSAQQVIQGKLTDIEGNGGIIGLDKSGHRVMEFNTVGMYRAWTDSNGDTGILFYGK